jgi:PAS domain S-box-containing protein
MEDIELSRRRTFDTKRSKPKKDSRLQLDSAPSVVEEMKDRLNILLRAIPDIVYFKDAKGRHLLVNEALEEFLGRKMEDVAGKTAAELLPPGSAKSCTESDKKVIEQGGTLRYEEQIAGKDGKPRFYDTIKSPVYGDAGKIVGLVGISRDITEQRRIEEELDQYRGGLQKLVAERTAELRRLNEEFEAELGKRIKMGRELRESHEFCRTVLNNMNDPIAIIDVSNQRIVEVNCVFLKEYAVLEDEVLGRKCHEVTHRSSNRCSPPLNACPLTETLRTGLHATTEHIHYDKGGRKIFVEVSTSPIRDDKGNVQQVVHVSKDITERKMAEEKLKTSREQLRRLSSHLQAVREQERTRISREIHDELGQVLTALKLDLSWLTSKYEGDLLLSEKTRSMLTLIDSTIKSIKRLCSELRPGVLDDLGLSAAIEWQAFEFQKHSGIACHLLCEPPNIVLDRDRSTAIFRIFQEALTNAVRHANATEIRVELKKIDAEVILNVRDNGRGITEKELSRPQSFGLIGMRERARSFNGTFHIDGVRGEGTTVTTRIPLGS